MASNLLIKKSVEDIWPINKKRFIIRVDFNVTIQGGQIVNDLRIRSALPTIRHVVEKGGIAILLSHNGCPKGLDTRKVNAKSRASILETWAAEKGRGLTTYFASLSGADKVEVLKGDSSAPKFEASRGSGKSQYFAALDIEKKVSLLDSFTEKQKRFADRQAYAYETTLLPVASYLQSLLPDNKVHFAPDALSASDLVRTAMPGEVCLLENLRLYSNETSASEEERITMARMLAAYGDYYVLDAFGCLHRTGASLTELPRVMQHGAAGFGIESELRGIAPALSNPARPMALILGGNKLKDSLQTIEQVMHRIDIIMLCGSLGLAFLKAKGANLGATPIDASDLSQVRSISERASQMGVRIVLPVDHVTNTSLSSNAAPCLTVDENVPSDAIAYDIGPQTAALFTRTIRTCRTALWVGVAGVAEQEPYHEGTVSLAKAMSQPNIYSIVGGRLTTAIVQASGYLGALSHVSTGGSVILQSISTRVLPASRSLTDRGSVESSSEYSVSVKDLIRNLKIFHSCSEKVLGAVVKKFVRRTYVAGDAIITEGDRHNCMWVVGSGSCCLHNNRGIKHTAERGDSIGMMRFLNNEPSEFTVTAATQVVTYFLSLSQIEDLCHSTPHFALELAQNVSIYESTSNADTLWSEIACNFDRTPNPAGSSLLPENRLGFATAVAEWVTHLASDVVAHAALGDLTSKSIANMCISTTALHALYHPTRRYLSNLTQVNMVSNPFLRILVAQDALALSAGAAAMANPAMAKDWVRLGVSALSTQVVSGYVTTRQRFLNIVLGILSGVLVALAFARDGKVAPQVAKRAVITAVAYLLLQRPALTSVDAAINFLGFKRSGLVRKDY
eukprot:PhM_4_TR13868/c0_g1_i1/m.74826/K00927/PGK, pgk; phosphoglycerate kinase